MLASAAVRVCSDLEPFSTACRGLTACRCLQFYGNNAPDDKVVFFGSKEDKHFGSYWVRDGKVVGAFSEGGSNEENAALKKVAAAKPEAPSDLASQGFAFASKL